MSKQFLLALPALMAGVVLAAPAAQEVLKSSDHDKIGGLLEEWVEARNGEQRKLTAVEAKENLRDELEKWRKKRGVDGRDPLSLSEDLGAAIYSSFAYDKQKGIKKGKVAEIETTTAMGAEIAYAMWAPSKYQPKAGPYPLILCIPESGEAPTDHLTEKWVDAGIRDGALLAAVPMPADPAAWTGNEGMANLFQVMKEMLRKYAVDYDRVYVAGRGVGVATAMTIASRFPDRFAGVIGRTGDAAELPPANFSNLPTYFAGAGKVATEFQEACKKAGFENVTLDPAGQEPEVWAWIQGHSRPANPTRVELSPGAPFPVRSFWLQVRPTDTDAALTATVDRATNTFEVRAEGVTHVTIFFNDALVDLDQPVKVIVNGAEHRDAIVRNLETFLEGVYTTWNDPGKVYVALREYEVPVSAAADGDAGGN